MGSNISLLYTFLPRVSSVHIFFSAKTLFEVSEKPMLLLLLRKE